MLSKKFSQRNNTIIPDERNQKHKLERSASKNPLREIDAKTIRNNPAIAIATGKIVVTDEAISGDCVNPIKKNDNNAVEGSPPMNPPVLLPNLSPARTVK